MKYLRELLIILSIYLLGEFISKYFNFPLPGNIIGMLILLTLLCLGIIDVKKVENVSNFFLDHLAFFFIPAGVGLITSLALLKDTWLQILMVCLLTTIFTIGVTGRIVQGLQKTKDN